MVDRIDSTGDGGAFAIADLWRPSAFTLQQEDPATIGAHPAAVPGEKRASEFLYTIGDALFDAPSYLAPLDPEAFQFGPLVEISEPESIAASSDIASISPHEVQFEEDLWLDSGSGLWQVHRSPPQGWESFYDATFVEPSRYLSEAGPRLYDAALLLGAAVKGQHPTHRVFQPEPMFRALRSLGLGHSSWLFDSASMSNSLLPEFPAMAISGMSPQITQSLIFFFKDCGTRFRQLQRFAASCSSCSRPSPVTTALAAVVLSALSTISSKTVQLSEDARTIIELKAAFQRPLLVLETLSQLVLIVQDSVNDTLAMGDIFRFICRNEAKLQQMRPLLREVLNAVTEPWLSAMSYCIGLKSFAIRDRMYIARIEQAAESSTKDQGGKLGDEVVPDFISVPDKVTMLETCNTLQVLRTYASEETLVKLIGREILADTCLKWMFHELSLQNNLERIFTREEALRAGSTDSTVCSLSQSSPTDPVDEYEDLASLLDPYGSTASALQGQFAVTLSRMQRTTGISKVDTLDRISLALDESMPDNMNLKAPEHSCPLSFAAQFSFTPLVESQHRLLGRASLQMLFRTYNIHQHFDLQRKYHLFGNGVFATRLSQSLFSSSMPTINGREDYSQSNYHGLRLDNRSTWPPGGSELRLVLMGILNESYFGPTSWPGSGSKELPGNLSFGIRHLSDGEIEKVMDPHSLTAVDFLRLQYTAPAPLDTIFTEGTMEKYDSIFKLLLRVSRLLAATSQIAPRRSYNHCEDTVSARFRIVASRFMEAVSGYFLHTAIAQPWARFEDQLLHLNQSLANPVDTSKRTSISSIRELRTAHESTLDTILFGLLLRRRQAPVMALLEEIFDLILRSAHRRQQNSASSNYIKDTRDLYNAFRAKTSTFLTVCRGLSGKKGYGAANTHGPTPSGAPERATIDELVLRLDMNGWWSAQK